MVRGAAQVAVSPRQLPASARSCSRPRREPGEVGGSFLGERGESLGVGRALIAACEDEAHRLGLGHIMLGVLTANKRAAEIYARAGYLPYASELRKHL